MDGFQTYGNKRDHCVPNSNYSFKQNHHYNCSRSGKSRPNWFICNDKTGKCQCGPGYYDNIRCDENKMVSAVMSCFCVTRSNNELYSGYCFYNCEQHTNIHKISNKVDLNKYMCGRFNRTGISCGECNNGTSPFVLSYNMSCVECSGGHKNWWKFALVGFVPLTNFYFLIVFLKINVISSRLHGLVLFSQVVSAPALIRLLQLKDIYLF